MESVAAVAVSVVARTRSQRSRPALKAAVRGKVAGTANRIPTDIVVALLTRRPPAPASMK
jgi:hypothetical protein